MKTLVVSLALALLATPVALAQESPAAPAPASPADEAARLANAGLLGRIIYALDQVGWVSTDAMQDKLSKARQKEVRGWIVQPVESGMIATYYGLKDGAPYGVFTAEVVQGKVTTTRDLGADASPLTPVQRAMIRARESVVSSKIETCGAPFNTVVIPPASDTGPVQVYLLTPQTKTGVFPAGRHFKITANPDGTFAARPFTNTCLNIGAPTAKAGEKPVGMFVTHILDKTPTEIHVLLSLQSRMPVYVSTAPDQVWQVNGPTITRVKTPAK